MKKIITTSLCTLIVMAMEVPAQKTDDEASTAARFVDEAVRLMGQPLPDNAKKQTKPMMAPWNPHATQIPGNPDSLHTVPSAMGDIWCTVNTEYRRLPVMSVSRFYYYRDDLENVVEYLNASGWEATKASRITAFGPSGAIMTKVTVYRKDGVEISFSAIVVDCRQNPNAPLGTVDFRLMYKTAPDMPAPIAPAGGVTPRQSPTNPDTGPGTGLTPPPTRRTIPCGACKGRRECRLCDGKGREFIDTSIERICQSCGGSKECKFCDGKGTQEVD